MDDNRFEVHCDASPNGQLHVRSQALSVTVSQAVNQNGAEDSWQSVLIICEQGAEGLLTTKIIVCHPDWDQNLQIACIRSGSAGKSKPGPAFEIDLKAVHV